MAKGKDSLFSHFSILAVISEVALTESKVGLREEEQIKRDLY